MLGRRIKIQYYTEDYRMNATKPGFLFAILILAISTPVYALEENTIRIENITSIPSIVNPVTLELARSVHAAPDWRNFLPVHAFWSPDGNKLLIKNSIGWLKDDIDFRPANRNGIDAIYTLDPDGTNLTKIFSNEINNRSTPIRISDIAWSPSGNNIAIYASRSRGGFFMISNLEGKQLNIPGTNLWDTTSIITNLSNISKQSNFIWSPDGTKAVFKVDQNKIYISEGNGSNIKQAATTVNEPFLWAEAWSHDGKQIAFSGKNLWIMNDDGLNPRRLGSCWGSMWSPDDSKLLCRASGEDDDQLLIHLYLIYVDNGTIIELINGTGLEKPVWSPGGNSILFQSITEGGNNGIYIAASSGRDLKLIYEMGSSVERATLDEVSWSPDGSKIAFVTFENGVNLYTINPDGTGTTLITSNLSWSWENPYVWSPSGDKIAFSSNTADGEHIFITDPDGMERTQITTGKNRRYALSGFGGSWSPDGSRLLIESSKEVFIAKLSGYDAKKLSKNVDKNITIQEHQGQSLPEPGGANTSEAKPIVIASAPKVSGFIATHGIIIISAIYFIKRRYN